MGDTRHSLYDLLPTDLVDDDDTKIEFLAQSLRLSAEWWKPVFLQEEYRLCKDLLIVHRHYKAGASLEGWRPSSKILAREWKGWCWDSDHVWEHIRTVILDPYRRRMWAAALAYDRVFSRRTEELRWIIVTFFTAGSVAAAVVLALARAGVFLPD